MDYLFHNLIIMHYFDIFIEVFYLISECGSSNSCIQQCNIYDDVIDKTDGPCPCNLYKNHSTPIGKLYFLLFLLYLW